MGWVEDEVGLDDGGVGVGQGWGEGWGEGAATLTNGAVRAGSGRVASRSLWLATSFLVAVLHVSLLSLWSLSLDRSTADHVVDLPDDGCVLVAAAYHISGGVLHGESRHPRYGQAELEILRAFHMHSHSSVVCPLA